MEKSTRGTGVGSYVTQVKIKVGRGRTSYDIKHQDRSEVSRVQARLSVVRIRVFIVALDTPLLWCLEDRMPGSGTGSVQVKDLKEELALWCPGTHALGPRVTAPLAMHASGSCLFGIVICSFTVLVVRNLSLWSITTNRLFIKRNVAVPVGVARRSAAVASLGTTTRRSTHPQKVF